MKKYQYLLGLCIAALLMPVLSSCEDDSLFFRTGSMSKLAFTVSTADDNGGSASTRGVVHVVDYFVDEEGDTLYLACKISDMDQPVVADSAVTRATPIYTNNLATFYGQFSVSAYKDGKVTRPVKETDEDGNELTGAQSYINIPYVPRYTGGTQQTESHGLPVWEIGSGVSDKFYWPTNGPLTFYAYAPTGSVAQGPSWTGLTPADNYKDGGVIEFDYTVPVSTSTPRKDAEAQPDILVSSVSIARSEASEFTETSTDTKYAIVPLTFYHALCAVEFHVNRADSPADELLKEDITVTSVSLGNLKGSGTCTFTPSSTGSHSADFISWDFTDVTDNDGNYSQAFNYKNVTPANNIDKAIGGPATTYMLIPQTVGGGSSATTSDAPDASVTLGYTSTSGTAKTKTISLHGSNAYEWKAGKKYTYILTGSLASLTLDGSLLTWGMDSAPLGLRHYVLTVKGPSTSQPDPVVIFNNPLDGEEKAFKLASYYYEGETDEVLTDRTPVDFTMEYQDEDGDWIPFTPQSTIAKNIVYNSSEPDAPYLSSRSASVIIDGVSTVCNDVTKKNVSPYVNYLREENLYVLGTNRALNVSSVPLLQDCLDKDPHLWDDEIYGYNTADNAVNWDLSRMDVGCELPEGGYNATAERNSANCYVVRRPGTYKFPVVYGNGLKGGSPSAAGGFTNTVPADQEKRHLVNFINALGEEIFTTTTSGGVKVVAGNALNDVWILTDMNGKKVNTVKITDRAKAALLWTDAQETVGGTTQQLISNVSLSKAAQNDYISFTTADNKHLTEGNAVIVLYFDADNDGTFEPDDNDFALWSWHIWVTDAHFAPDNLAEITASPGTIAGSSYTYAGTYHYMNHDLGECDNPSKLYTMKADWRKEFQIRFKQVEGDAGYQYLTIKMPDMERPTAPNALYYQWGRKDPFPGKTNADNASTDPKPYYYLGSTTATLTLNAIDDPGHWSTGIANQYDEAKTQSLSSIQESIRRPSYFLKAAGVTDMYGRSFFNLWNLIIPIPDINDGDEVSDACVYTPVTKTIYDPCPYGFVTPNLKSAFPLANSITRVNQSTYLVADPLLKPSTFWYGAIYDDASLVQEQNLIFPSYGSRNAATGVVDFVNFNFRYSSSNPSVPFYVNFPRGSVTVGRVYTGVPDLAVPIRPILESDNH